MNHVLMSVFAATSLALAQAAPANVNVGNGARSLKFDVFLDDKVIGYQRFDLTQGVDGTRMQTRAEFEVKFLLITAFSYDHSNTELWRNGCLHAIDSRTDSNGKMYSVSGRAQGSAFLVETNEGEQSLGACVSTFAYWDKEILLRRKQLLNSQTGEYMPIRIESLGQDRVSIGQREVAVDRYVLTGKGIEISLAYAVEDGSWVALDNKLDGGRTLRYRRSPDELNGSSSIRKARVVGQESGQ